MATAANSARFAFRITSLPCRRVKYLSGLKTVSASAALPYSRGLKTASVADRESAPGMARLLDLVDQCDSVVLVGDPAPPAGIAQRGVRTDAKDARALAGDELRGRRNKRP